MGRPHRVAPPPVTRRHTADRELIDRLPGMARTNHALGMTLVFGLGLFGCDKPPEPEVKIERRTDFRPEEFGVGRPHTRNVKCNQEIDRLLDATRLCFNSRPEPDCNRLQEKNADTIARIKGMARCRHP